MDESKVMVKRGKVLGSLVYWFAIVFVIVQTVALIGVMKFIYDDGVYKWYGKSKVDWAYVSSGWTIAIGAWVFGLFLTTVFAAFGALTRIQAKSLELQIP